jgi:flagellar motor switch protein FliN/FliY
MAGPEQQDLQQEEPLDRVEAEAEDQKAESTTGESKSPKTDEMRDDKLTGNMDFLLDIPLEISVELGRTKMLINELLKLGQGSVIELSKLAGETLEILANQKLVARGEVVVVNEKYGVRLTEIISPSERVERLK